VPGVWQIDYLPFQRVYGEEGTLVFRPSWSPDGERIVFSDGLNLSIWNPGSGAVEAIPGTADGVTPAWSPTGEWIAFTRLERRGSQSHFCQHFVPMGDTVACAEQRTDHEIGRRILTLIRPDGSEILELGDGEEPAWAPDGSVLYFRRDDRIWRHDLREDEPTAIAGTEAGREPEVSPDGTKLAFARREAGGAHSIWIATLEP
jgi:Tol biopolymer transport system component